MHEHWDVVQPHLSAVSRRGKLWRIRRDLTVVGLHLIVVDKERLRASCGATNAIVLSKPSRSGTSDDGHCDHKWTRKLFAVAVMWWWCAVAPAPAVQGSWLADAVWSDLRTSESRGREFFYLRFESHTRYRRYTTQSWSEFQIKSHRIAVQYCQSIWCGLIQLWTSKHILRCGEVRIPYNIWSYMYTSYLLPSRVFRVLSSYGVQ